MLKLKLQTMRVFVSVQCILIAISTNPNLLGPCLVIQLSSAPPLWWYSNPLNMHPYQVISRDTEAYKGYHRLCTSILSGSVQSLNVSDEIPRYSKVRGSRDDQIRSARDRTRTPDSKNKVPDSRTPLIRVELEKQLGSSPTKYTSLENIGSSPTAKYASSDEGSSSPLHSHR